MNILFWKVAKACNITYYNEVMDDLEKMNPTTTVIFRVSNPKVFCRAFMKPYTKADVIMNNLVETFNGYIINGRTKHMIYMLNDTRTTLMQRLVLKRREMEKSSVVVCVRIQAKSR